MARGRGVLPAGWWRPRRAGRAAFQERPHPAPATSATDPDAVALVLFTSGTTGEPKAVLRKVDRARLRTWLASEAALPAHA
jgi:acyl-coenzyme A synthetase/AMP-(fatty) acid ligase